MKLITFVVPCYNAAEYMDRCIQSLLPCGEEAEIILINDGSDDNDATKEKADSWQRRAPNLIRVIHQDFKGPGGAVNTGLAHAAGLYFKVIDAFDWLDQKALADVCTVLRRFRGLMALDMMICNCVYDHLADQSQKPVIYHRQFPRGQVFNWNDTRHFTEANPLLMQSILFRTQVLKDCGICLPENILYVDNILAYEPLKYCKRLYYLDVDLHHYLVGRENQSTNDAVLLEHIEDQLTVTRVMIDSVRIFEEVQSRRLQQYMIDYITLMMAICSVFLLMSKRSDKNILHRGLWAYLKLKDQKLYRKIRTTFTGIGSNLKGPLGRRTMILLYHVNQKFTKS